MAIAMSSANRAHILAIPPLFLGLRAAQFVVAIVVLGLAAFATDYIDRSGLSLSLFMAIATIIITVYVLVAELFFPIVYNYWAILGLDIFGVILWMVAFILTAVQAADLDDYYGSSGALSFLNQVSSWFKRDLALQKRTTWKTYKNTYAATAAMGALEFVLFIATLALTIIYLLRHRANGGHCMYNGGAATNTATANYETKETELTGQPASQDANPVVNPTPASNAVV